MDSTHYHFKIFPLKLTINQTQILTIHPLTQFRIKIFSGHKLQAQLKAWTYAGNHNGVIEFEKQPLTLSVQESQKHTQKIITLFEIDHKVQRNGDTLIHKVQKQQVVGKATLPISEYIDKFEDFNAHYVEEKLKLSHAHTLHFLVYVENTLEGVDRIITEHEKLRVFNLLNKNKNLISQNDHPQIKFLNKLRFIKEEEEEITEMPAKKDQLMDSQLDQVFVSVPGRLCDSVENKQFQEKQKMISNSSMVRSKNKVRRKQTFLQQILKMVLPYKQSLQESTSNESDCYELQIGLQKDNPKNLFDIQEKFMAQFGQSQVKVSQKQNFNRQSQEKKTKNYGLKENILKDELMNNQIKKQVQINENKKRQKAQDALNEEKFKLRQKQKGWNRLILYIIGFVFMFVFCILIQQTTQHLEQKVPQIDEVIHQYMEEKIQIKAEENQRKVKIMAKIKYQKGAKGKKSSNNTGVTFTFKK